MQWLTRWFSGCALAGALAFTLLASGTAAELPSADAEQVRGVIEAQLAAFAADDAAGAFGLATPAIRTMFGDAEHFMAMVRNGYAVVYRPASVSFLAPTLDADGILQAVRMADDDGALWLVVYLVQRQDDGSWRIGGCQAAKVEGRAT